MNKAVLWNVILNTAGTVTNILAGFFVLPFLIRNLGAERYGLWILIASMTSYFSVLDFGISASIGQKIARCRATDDVDGINRVLSTAWFILWGVFLLVCLATFAVGIAFFHVFEVPADQVADVRLALYLVGLQLAFSFPAWVFGGLLWGYERFDLQNYVDIPCVVLRTALTFLLVDRSATLSLLGAIVLGVAILSFLLKAIVCYAVQPNLRLRRDLAGRETARELFAFGIWYFILNFARNLTPQIGIMVIGNRLSAREVTPYNVAKQMTIYTNTFMVTGTQVLAPQATKLHAQDDRVRQRQLFLDGGRFSLAFALFFVGAFLFLGKPLIGLWTPGLQDEAAGYLMLLILGELLPMSQWITYSTIVGMGKHQLLAGYALLELAAVFAFAFLLAPTYGVWGVCWAVAIPGTLVRGLCQWLFGCRLIEVSPGHYALRVFAPIILFAATPFLVLAGLVQWHVPATWVELFAFGGAYAAVYAGVVGGLLWFPSRKR